ncbi:methyltransferase domain-containing protein [Variovorax sp. PCZ-1]|uniref:methyltransferase domain-containing protein n=1 Tax=Variovorax sp. PCZ-1 TaxID=2835533 RepID=UPI001BD1162A|nr:methyltransferase domain-containing protein [Variovorax sp. PCZ-1]MBS7808309.1 methyltransferase domain-containing protein [Variovorax sp. PCZ-1]
MTDADPSPPPLDAHAAQRWQSLLARRALKEGAPWLHEEVGSRMAQRLAWIKKQPMNWVNWRAASSGAAVHSAVGKQYPNSDAFLAPAGVESARAAPLLIANQGMVQSLISKLQGQSKRMLRPVEDSTAQMVWANMALHTEPDPAATVKEWHRMLAVDGFLMFSCLGPDTALELRQVFDKEGWSPAAHPLTDMHDWGDLLVGTGFAEPVMDMERIVLGFSSAERALQELRGVGRNLHPARFSGLRGRIWKNQLLKALNGLKNSQGQIELTFEVIYGHAFKPAPRLKVSAESAISMRDMRAMLASHKPRT